MRKLRIPAALAGVAAVGCLVAMPAPKAFNLDLVNGSSCQLSVPTTSTGVRPKASGFRNESATTSNFMICSFQRSSTAGDYVYVGLIGYSLDGAVHDVTCTAAAGNYPALRYSSKTAGIRDATEVPFVWSAEEFGGRAGATIDGSLYFSITCNLPPQTAISYVQAQS